MSLQYVITAQHSDNIILDQQIAGRVDVGSYQKCCIRAHLLIQGPSKGPHQEYMNPVLLEAQVCLELWEDLFKLFS